MQLDPTIYGENAQSPDVDPSSLSPGVRMLVEAPREAGLEATDSGDGSNYEAGMECALPFPHVFIACPPARTEDVAKIARDAIAGRVWLADWPMEVEALVDEGDGIGLVAVWHRDYEDLMRKAGR